MKNKYYFSA